MPDEKRINVLVMEDSRLARMRLAPILAADPAIAVVGVAANGGEIFQLLAEKGPDVVLLDIDMPEKDGFETTRRIMETHPLPIIVCGSSRSGTAMPAFRHIEAGAVAAVEKPPELGREGFAAAAAHLVQTVKLMSEVKVVRRWAKTRRDGTLDSTPTVPRRTSSRIKLVAIGASTGGPPVLQTILTDLPKDFPVPILIVQHIAVGFSAGLVQWLSQTTGFNVQLADNDVQPMPGNVYVAPDNMHMAVRSDGRISLDRADPENRVCPSIDYLFRSLADRVGASAIGVLLTGMGKDGAVELKRMRDRGALTIAQDRETSVVHGMPGEAIALGAATYVLPADRIAPALLAAVNSRTATERGEA